MYLTNREIDVIKLVCQGDSNRDIAEKLFVSTHTVKAHLSSIFYKLGARNRAHATYLYLTFMLGDSYIKMVT